MSEGVDMLERVQGTTALARRLYLHVKHGGAITERHMERLVRGMEEAASTPEAAGRSGEELVLHNARGIVGYMFERFYPEIENPNILPDVFGLMTQISHMVTGLQRKPSAPPSGEHAAVPETKD